MNKLRVAGAVTVVGLAALAVWVAGMNPGPAGTAAETADTDRAYDYEARDVIVRQMGPDGALQYEIEARQVTQLPGKGQISAETLVMRHDPPGSTPGGRQRWTLTADRADLPEESGALTLQGNVQAQGRTRNSPVLLSFSTEELTYDLDAQTIQADKDVQMTRGGDRYTAKGLRANIKTDMVTLGYADGTLEP